MKAKTQTTALTSEKLIIPTKKTSSLVKFSVPKMTASLVKAVLRMHYAAPNYAVLEEVRNATGLLKKRYGLKPRYADLIAMGLYPSEGLEISGFEVKVSRADWLSEISDEKKAVAVKQFCDRWYLVTHSDKVVKAGELPADWGWLVAEKTEKGYVLREIVAAPKLNAMPITRAFLASLMRNATTSNPDYINVQSKILQESAGKPVGRVVAKARRRFTSTIKSAGKRKTNREAAANIIQGLTK